MFLPRQVMLAAKNVTKRKEEEKCDFDQKWRTTYLLHSIVGFLERSGFRRTLSVLRSEAKLDFDDFRDVDFDFEEVFGKFVESSVGSLNANIAFNKGQDLCNDANTKRKRKEKANNKSSDMLDAIGDTEYYSGKELSTSELLDPLIARKEKKRKKKRLDFPSKENSKLVSMEMIQKEKDMTCHEGQHNEPQEETKRKRKRTKFASGFLEDNVELYCHTNMPEFVQGKLHYVKSFLQNDSAQSDTKLKTEKKKKAKLVHAAAVVDQDGLPNCTPGNFLVKDCNVSEQYIKNFRENNCSDESGSEPNNMKKVKFEVMQHFDKDVSCCRGHPSRATSLEKHNNVLTCERTQRSEMDKSKKSKKRNSPNSGLSEHDNIDSNPTSEERISECIVDNMESETHQKVDFLVLGNQRKRS